MALIRPQQDLDKPGVGEHYYEAIVVDNVDPQQLHRVKIRVEELHGTVDNIPDSNLPWAIHFRPTFLGGGAELSGAAIPRVGSKVTVQHLRGDIYQPVYMFELADNSTRSTKAQQNYPDSYLLEDSDGNYWHVDMVDDKLDIKFNGNECVEITVDRDTIIGQDDTETIARDKTKEVGRDETNHILRDRTTDVDRNEANNILNNQTNTVGVDQNNTVNNNRTEGIGSNLTQTVGQTKTVNSTRLVINTSADVDINASANVTVDGSNIILNGGGGGGVVTSSNINHATGLPHGDSSGTVTCDG